MDCEKIAIITIILIILLTLIYYFYFNSNEKFDNILKVKCGKKYEYNPNLYGTYNDYLEDYIHAGNKVRYPTKKVYCDTPNRNRNFLVNPLLTQKHLYIKPNISPFDGGKECQTPPEYPFRHHLPFNENQGIKYDNGLQTPVSKKYGYRDNDIDYGDSAQDIRIGSNVESYNFPADTSFMPSTYFSKLTRGFERSDVNSKYLQDKYKYWCNTSMYGKY